MEQPHSVLLAHRLHPDVLAELEHLAVRFEHGELLLHVKLFGQEEAVLLFLRLACIQTGQRAHEQVDFAVVVVPLHQHIPRLRRLWPLPHSFLHHFWVEIVLKPFYLVEIIAFEYKLLRDDVWPRVVKHTEWPLRVALEKPSWIAQRLLNQLRHASVEHLELVKE